MLLGLAVLPPGRAKRELRAMLCAWTSSVYSEVWLERLQKEGDAAVDRLLAELAKRATTEQLTGVERHADESAERPAA